MQPPPFRQKSARQRGSIPLLSLPCALCMILFFHAEKRVSLPCPSSVATMHIFKRLSRGFMGFFRKTEWRAPLVFPFLPFYCTTQKCRQIYRIIIAYQRKKYKHFTALAVLKPACRTGQQGYIAPPCFCAFPGHGSGDIDHAHFHPYALLACGFFVFLKIFCRATLKNARYFAFTL